MKRGNGMFAILFICSMALCVITGLAYFKLENRDFAKATNAVEDVRSSVSAVEDLQKTVLDQQKNFSANTVTALADLTGRVSALENRPKDINLNLSKPLQISIVYRKAVKKLPDTPKIINGKLIKTPMLDRAGISQ